MKRIGRAGSTRRDVVEANSLVAPHQANRRERLAWALYGFANSGYTTVVLTTIFSAYFVGVGLADRGYCPQARPASFRRWRWAAPSCVYW